jgi:Tfp pilus assembly protein PilX
MAMNGKQRGFALVTAILAIMILMALGYLVVSVSTGDLRISSRVVGEKKALSAAETGIHRLTKGFTPLDLSAIWVESVRQPVGVERQANPADPASRYIIINQTLPPNVPASWPLPGFSSWEQKSYSRRVTGRNTAYGSEVQIDVGIGYAAPSTGTQYE